MNLRLDWCSYEAAKYACAHWHYSRSLPCSKTARIGVWENGRFIGCLIFAWGSNKNLSCEFSLKMTECIELCRVALAEHKTPVSRIVSIALKMLKRAMPGIRLVVSYADPNRSHNGKSHTGTIYKAGGWLYIGTSQTPEAGIMLKGKLTHRRTINSKYPTSSLAWLRRNIDPNARIIDAQRKHKYLYPLDAEVADRVRGLSKPYPKKRAASETIDTPGHQPGKRGEAPTAALQRGGV